MQDFKYSKNQYRCRRCGQPLTARLERRDGDLALPCWNCGAKNIVVAVLKVIGWRP